VLFNTLLCGFPGGKREKRPAGADVQTAQHAVQSEDEWNWLSTGGPSCEGDIPR